MYNCNYVLALDYIEITNNSELWEHEKVFCRIEKRIKQVQDARIKKFNINIISRRALYVENLNNESN